jgi:hypothetical protein
LVLLPTLLFLCLLDVPFILWAALWGLVIQAADPNRFSALTPQVSPFRLQP